jgi:2,4-dienoyl-CoA reductase-like NADH-dependent reductase (Old Yellow Enzyme family)
MEHRRHYRARGRLKERGVDVFHSSSGGIDGPLTLHAVPRVPGYHFPSVRRIRWKVVIRTMAVGLITTGAQAESYLEAEDCDLVAPVREMPWNPNWPVHAAQEFGLDEPHEILPPALCLVAAEARADPEGVGHGRSRSVGLTTSGTAVA